MISPFDESLYAAFDHSPLAVTITGLDDGRLVYVNEGFIRFSGYGREEAIGRTPDELRLWVDPNQRRHGLERLRAGHALSDVEARFRTRNGEERVGVIGSAPVTIRGRACALSTVVDITDRKRIEQDLAAELAATQRLQAFSTMLVQEGDVDALYEQLLDAATAIMRSDFASIQIFDDSRGELRLLGHRGFIDEAARYWARVPATSGTSCGAALRLRQRVIVRDVHDPLFTPGDDELAMYAKAGIRAMQSTPLTSRTGYLLGMLSTHWRAPHEASERDLRLFDVLARQAGDLIERARAEQKLRDSEEHLRLANQMKDDFLATLSHELRTPLNAILGWAHMLRTGTLRPDVAERALESLERNARAQAQLVEDLLDVSRIVSGKLQIATDAVDLSAVIAAAVETVRPAADARRVTLQVAADPDRSVVVQGDADRLRQVVWNLLSNAVKFTPSEGHVSVTLASAWDRAEIVVHDTGDGIDAEFLPYVFERFRQADGTTTRRHTGLGLGLAIVRHLTEAHGGTVTAHSDGRGTGATFTVLLPCVPAADTDAPAEPLPVASHVTLSGLRVLVVDDELDARELLRVVLESAGAAVVPVSSAADALHALRAQAFDVLVADIAMPHQDGYALLRGVRALSSSAARIPAIAVTAHASAADRELAATAGFAGHVAKPVDPARLVSAVAAVQASTPAN